MKKFLKNYNYGKLFIKIAIIFAIFSVPTIIYIGHKIYTANKLVADIITKQEEDKPNKEIQAPILAAGRVACKKQFKEIVDDEIFGWNFDGDCVSSLLISEGNNQLNNSRNYFDNYLKKQSELSRDLKFIIHPKNDDGKGSYREGYKRVFSADKVSENIKIVIGKYTLEINEPTKDVTDNVDVDSGEQITSVMKVFNNNVLIDTQKYTSHDRVFSHLYRMEVGNTTYMYIGLCGGGMHGCGTLIPIVSDSRSYIHIGNSIDTDFSNYIPKDSFFTKNGELYTSIDDQRYFFKYKNVSNNASYRSSLPIIYKFDKKTAGLVPAPKDYISLYRKCAQIIEKDITALNKILPPDSKLKETNGVSGLSITPYFDYWLGLEIVSSSGDYDQKREKVKKLYFDFYGKDTKVEAHFDAYKEYEK